MNPGKHWKPTASLANLQTRARVLRDIRSFFDQHGVLEVETPLASQSGNTDPEIDSVTTDGGTCLRTSPEFAMKRLLAAGSGDIFELGRVFRAGEAGRHHNPEFTLLEWYRVNCSYHELMDEVVRLVRYCSAGKFDQWPARKLSYRDLFKEYLDIDPWTASVAELSVAGRQHGIDELELEHRQWLDLLISLAIQPTLPKQALTLVYDYPSDQAALARIRLSDPPVAERFELYLGRRELANGYQELTDATEQRGRFEAENRMRSERGKPVCPLDHHLLSALAHGLPACSGVALGVDRLLMAICDSDSISEVLAFPAERA